MRNSENISHIALGTVRSQLHIVDNTELQTLILVSIQTLKRKNKKCGTEEFSNLC